MPRPSLPFASGRNVEKGLLLAGNTPLAEKINKKYTRMKEIVPATVKIIHKIPVNLYEMARFVLRPCV